MASYTNLGRDNMVLLPEGDYVVKIVSLIEAAQTRKGDEKFVFRASTEKGGYIRETFTFSQSAAWRIDTWIKSVGFPIKVGESREMKPEDFIGWSGWAHVNQRPWKGDDGKEKVSNEVQYWITDRPKFARDVPPADDPPSDFPDASGDKPPF